MNLSIAMAFWVGTMAFMIWDLKIQRRVKMSFNKVVILAVVISGFAARGFYEILP